jgi:hypothetical protein
MDGGKDAFDYLKRALKSLVAEMITIFTKRWVLQLGAAVTGNTSLSALADETGRGTVGGSLLDSFRYGGAVNDDYSSMSYGESAGVGAAGYAGAGMMGYGIGTMAHSMFGNDRNQMGMQGGASAGAMIGTMILPGIGTIVGALIGALIGSFISSGGGAKVEGGYYAAYNAQGQSQGERPLTAGMGYGEHAPNFWRTNEGGGAAKEWVRGIAEGYYTAVLRMGGTAQAFNFGGGVVTDPQGTAPGFVHSLLTGPDGNVISNYRNNQVGRSDEAVQEEMRLQTYKVILTALRLSKPIEQVANVLNSIDIDTASASEIEDIIDLGMAFGDLFTLLGEFDADEIIADYHRTSIEVFDQMGVDLLELLGRTQPTAESIRTLTTSVAGFEQAAAQMIVAMEQIKERISTLFGDLIEDILTSTMTPQEQYNYYQAQAQTLYEQAMSSTDPEFIGRAAEQIAGYYRQAWNLIPDELKPQYQQQYLTNINTTQTTLTDRVNTLQANLISDTQAILTQINTSITAMTTDMQKAADTQNVAADKNLAAANTDQTITVVVKQQNDGGGINNDGG